MQGFIDRVAAILPYSAGYASPALSCAEFFSEAVPLTRRYLGFDVANQMAVADDLGNQPAGVYWINVFGPALSEKFGRLSGLRAALPEEVRVVPSGGGGVRIVLGPVPDALDVNRPTDVLQMYRQVAGLLQPDLHVPSGLYFRDEQGLFDQAGQERWHFRFLT